MEDGKIPGEVHLRAGRKKIHSRRLVSAGREVNYIPPPEASFNSEKVWVASHSPLWPRSDLCTVAAFKPPSEDPARAHSHTQDGIPAALLEVNGAGFAAHTVGSPR